MDVDALARTALDVSRSVKPTQHSQLRPVPSTVVQAGPVDQILTRLWAALTDTTFKLQTPELI